MRVAAVLIGAAFVTGAAGQTPISPKASPKSANEETWTKTVQPVLAKYCYGCHNEKLRTAGLSLEAFRAAADAMQQTGVWEKVLDRVSSGKMPPAGLPAPDKAEALAVTAWIGAV